MAYKVMAGIVLAAFYGIYFGKLYLYRRKCGRSSGRGEYRTTELVMKLSVLAVVLAEILSIIFSKNDGLGGLRFLGLIIAIGGIVIQLAAAKAMGDIWQPGVSEKDTPAALVMSGIYSISRNPEALGFCLLCVGLLIMFFTWWLMLVTVFVVVMLHLQVLKEEKYLAGIFGVEYFAYKNRTLRYVGKRKNAFIRKKRFDRS